VRKRLQHCTIGFESPRGSLLLGLEQAEYGFGARQAQVAGEVFNPKAELHVTLLGSSTLRDLPADTAACIAAHAARENWYVELLEQYWLLRNPAAEQGKTTASIIQMVEVYPLQAFLAAANQRHALVLQPPPTHITLYVQGGGCGIALNDHDSWRHLRQRRLFASELPPRNPARETAPRGGRVL